MLGPGSSAAAQSASDRWLWASMLWLVFTALGQTALAEAATSYRIVFASNLQATSGGCVRDNAAGCDLYSLKYDSGTRAVSELTRLTHHNDAAEMFPAISPDGDWVAYDYSPNANRNQHELRLIHLPSGTETTLLSGARFPEWIDTSHLVVSLASGASQDITVLELTLGSSSASLRASESICSRTRCPDTAKSEDAFPFPDGSRFAFQSIKSDRYVAGLSLINRDGTSFQMPNGWDGSGHAIVSRSGQEVVYTVASSGALKVLDLSTNTRATPLLTTSGSALVGYDPRFAAASSVSWAYAAWLDGSRALLLSAAGANSGGSQTISRLILGEFSSNWSSVSLTDLAGAIETAQGKTGRDFCTASARALAGASPPTVSAAGPLLGIMGASQGDLATVASLGANTAQVPLPATSAALTSLLDAAASADLKLVLSVDRAAVQNSAWKFDLTRLSILVNALKTGLADARVAAILLAEDLCQVNSSAHTREWDLSSSELAAAISTIKSIVPSLAVAVSFNKSSCLDSFVAGAAAGSNIADIALLNCFYYKWSTTPQLIDSYQVSALAFKRFSPNARVLPRIGVVETVGENASSFPTADWLLTRSLEFFAFGGAFDGVMYYDYRQQEATQVKNIVNVAGEAAYVSFFQTAFASAQAIYGTTPAVKSFIEYYEATLDHYFITADADEQAFVSTGAAGAWQRTGDFLKEGGTAPVCRFYGNSAINPATGAMYGPNSHFYTVDAGECANLKSLYSPNAPGWKFETSAFSSTAAGSGTCASGTVPVYRAYNNGYRRGVDANHRITSNAAAYQQTLAAGWIGEGVVMCAPQ